MGMNRCARRFLYKNKHFIAIKSTPKIHQNKMNHMKYMIKFQEFGQ